MRSALLSFVLFIVATAPALAWHETGHSATARIAWAELSEAQKRDIDRILRAHPRFEEDFAAHMPSEVSNSDVSEQTLWMFQQAANWPDIVRDIEEEERRIYNKSRWHYINLVIWHTPEDEAELTGTLGHNMDTSFQPPMRRELNAVQALRGNLEIWRDDSSSDADKAVALCWILHITGDLHQPLHTVALFNKAFFPRGDRGGNSVQVQWGDDTRNLHAVWDGLPTGMDDLSPTARTLQSIAEDVVDDDSVEEWIDHHASLAERYVYTEDVREQLLASGESGQAPTVSLSHEYLVSARAIARRQINLAGHRIAALLQK